MTNFIPVRGAELASITEGSGAPIIFLHGGPGDTHHYMKRMAEPLFKNFRCIFFDQRGTGESQVEVREASQFGLELMLEDLKAVQAYYKTGPCMLVGHSWGAMYGLFACIQSPNNFTKTALLNMGPLDSEMEQKTSEHLLATLSSGERAIWNELRQARTLARDRNDLAIVLETDKRLMKLRVKAWVFNPELHEAFLEDYFQDPPPDREVNKWVWESLGDWFSWDRLSETTTSTWVCVGENDSVPVSQAERVAELMPNARLSVFERCGHVPWMEHPEKLYSDLTDFLKSLPF